MGGALIIKAIFHGLRALFAKEERVKWFMAAEFFWTVIPEICTYSAMRLLHFVTPAVLTADFSKYIAYSSTRWHRKVNGRCQHLVFRKWLKFIATRVFCLVIGLDAFLVKVN